MIFPSGRLQRLLQDRGLLSLFWLGGEKVLQLVFAAVSVGLIARTLGVDAFGQFQYVLSILSVFSVVGLVAGPELAAPLLARRTQAVDRRHLLGSLFVLRLAASAAAFLLMAAWSLWREPPDLRLPLLVLSVSLLVAEPFNVLRLIREVSQYTRVFTLIRLLMSSLELAAIAVLYVLRMPLTAFVAVYSIQYFLMALCYVCTVREDGPPWRWPIARERMLWLLRQGVTVWLGIQALTLIQRLDRLVLHGRLSADLYGQYSAALGLLSGVWFFGTVAVVALAPSLVYRSAPGTSRPAWHFVGILAVIGLLAALATSALAPVLIPLIFGAGFAPAVEILRAAAFILVPGFAALSLDALLIQAGRHRAVPLKWVAGLGVGALLILPDLGLSWWQGPLAVAAAYVTSLLVGVFCLRGWKQAKNSRIGL